MQHQHQHQHQQSSDTQSTIQILQTFLYSRLDQQHKLLSLSGMYSDPYLLQNGLLANDNLRAKMFTALMKIAANSEMKDVESVDLSRNSLRELTPVTTLAQTYPRLKNLSLAENAIDQWRHLDIWRQKFRELNELVLLGNPITSLPNYRAEVIRRFPSLKMLDGETVGPNPFQANITKLPIATRPGFFENEQIQSITMDFLGKFLQVYDSDRTQLLPLYDSMSMFSISLNTGVPREMGVAAGGKGGGHYNTFQGSSQNWSSYIPLSRNLVRIHVSQRREARLAVGQEQIMGLLRSLPATRHDLSSPEKFSIDAWTMRGLRTAEDAGIMLIVHGEFEEPSPQQTQPNRAPRQGQQQQQQQQGLKRSFDRAMTLLPVAATGEILVVSDTLTVRSWAGSRAWGGSA
ncbi:hypothetical protein BZA70DRAFT_236236 [Myxozyma melibiosi]|uniref:NTF2 domain-containing protein n=1 Tax=Myxozyma melibiosi TaxID=54550 RepID=A0ABR1FCQ4_9ASCO